MTKLMSWTLMWFWPKKNDTILCESTNEYLSRRRSMLDCVIQGCASLQRRAKPAQEVKDQRPQSQSWTSESLQPQPFFFFYFNLFKYLCKLFSITSTEWKYVLSPLPINTRKELKWSTELEGDKVYELLYFNCHPLVMIMVTYQDLMTGDTEWWRSISGQIISDLHSTKNSCIRVT